MNNALKRVGLEFGRSTGRREVPNLTQLNGAISANMATLLDEFEDDLFDYGDGPLDLSLITLLMPQLPPKLQGSFPTFVLRMMCLARLSQVVRLVCKLLPSSQTMGAPLKFLGFGDEASKRAVRVKREGRKLSYNDRVPFEEDLSNPRHHLKIDTTKNPGGCVLKVH